MNVFIDGKLNHLVFEQTIRENTQALNDAVVAAVQTQSPTIESTHFLIVLAQIPKGVTDRALSLLGLSAADWRSGLSKCASHAPGTLPPSDLTQECLHPSASAMFGAAEERSGRDNLKNITEGVLLLSALENVTEPVRELFDSVDISLEDWCGQIEDMIRPVTPIRVFNDDEVGSVCIESFSARGRSILSLLQGETESLGYKTATPRHLLLALLAQGGGATEYGVHQQGLAPRRIQETVMLSIGSRTNRTPSSISLDRNHFQTALQWILEGSGEIAARAREDQITESHIFLSILEVETAARRILEDENVEICRLREVIERYEVNEEDLQVDQDQTHEIADIETIAERLKTRLVGQDDAIQRIVPYLQRLRLGFSVPGRPEGVFLFCGGSGTGKTEMAKELARAVFGSEDDLIFLEMGQFKGEHSMSIFVGAPPGYIGYGGGKLTNGLRDNPRSVVLFDEVEKAHPQVLDALLRFLDEGKIDDPAGPVRDGSKCIVILTSNVGSEELADLWRNIEKDPDYQTVVRQTLRKLFKKHNFRVEFLNRVDELILFKPLDADNYAEIAKRFLQKHLQRLHDQCQIEVEITGVYEEIGAYCERLDEGARQVHRLGLSNVITPAIDFVSQNNCSLPVKLHIKSVTAEPGGEPTSQVELAQPGQTESDI